MTTSIKDILLHTHLNHAIIASNPTSTFQSTSQIPHTGLLVTWLTLTVHHLLLHFPVFQTFDEKSNQYSDFLRTILVINHNSSPLCVSIRDEHFKAKSDRRQAERKFWNIELGIFKDLYRKATQ